MADQQNCVRLYIYMYFLVYDMYHVTGKQNPAVIKVQEVVF